MEQLRILVELWPVLVTIVGIIVWVVKLEAKSKANREKIIDIEKSLTSLWIEHNALNNKTLSQLSQIRESLARIEGRLSVSVQQ